MYAPDYDQSYSIFNHKYSQLSQPPSAGVKASAHRGRDRTIALPLIGRSLPHIHGFNSLSTPRIFFCPFPVPCQIQTHLSVPRRRFKRAQCPADQTDDVQSNHSNPLTSRGIPCPLWAGSTPSPWLRWLQQDLSCLDTTAA